MCQKELSGKLIYLQLITRPQGIISKEKMVSFIVAGNEYVRGEVLITSRSEYKVHAGAV